jgi:micrococcal nuclease
MRRDEDYGRILPTRRWQGRPPRSRWPALRWWLAAVALAGLVWWADSRWRVPERGTPTRVAAQFHRCGQGRGPNCVIDGDTFIMASRHFRIAAIDAPEIGAKARCPREAMLAEEAAAELLRLLNLGPFIRHPPEDGLRDDYGRELVNVTRPRSDGTMQDLSVDLIASGKVRRLEFGPRGTWC